ncbi:MAG: FAD-binding oxidoreductase [Saprospiraceae bacterium]|nr:FAD-binding oxidoreductase [Saprospiraceae bacterium]
MSSGNGHAPSYWEKRTFLRRRNLIIVGSGIVGLSAALEAKRKNPKWSILVVDRSMVPHGASTKNAGFACFGSPSELLSDIEKHGWDDMITLVKKRWEGLQILMKLVPEQDLNYIPCGGYEVFNDAQRELLDECLEALPALNEALSFIGHDVFHHRASLQDHGLENFHGIIACPYEASIHPGMMMRSLIRQCHTAGIEFLNGLDVSAIDDQGDKTCIQSKDFEVTSDYLLLATNAFTTKLLPEIDLYPARNQVVVTTPINNLQLKGIYHHDAGYVYFRTVEGNRILLGGARNIFEQQERTDQITVTENVLQHLQELLARKIVPGTTFGIDYQWSGILGLGSQKTPLVQWYSDRIFVACRMGGMGISIGAHIGQTAAFEMVTR